MKSFFVKRNALRVRAIFLGSVFAGLLAAAPAFAQSSDQNYPTPVTTTEISGEIRARDIGDSRLTTHFYTFDGSQGDVFVNIVSRNFNGDIDIFTLKELRPLTKVVVYADLAENETGRVIYLRKPENLLLRIQGRTPNDDPATYRIKFAGSFVASSRQPGPEMPALPEVTAKSETGIRVNSVGTILEVPKPSPSPVEEVATSEEAVAKKDETAEPSEEVKPEPDAAEKKAEVAKETTPPAEPEKKVEVVVTDTLPEKPRAEAPARNRRTARNRNRRNTRKPAPPKAEEKPAEETVAETNPEPEAKPATESKDPEKVEPADPLANVRLVVLFKDGKRIERPMSEVFRFSVDKGTLTVVSKDGRIGRYPLLDISEVTIK